MIDLYTWATPNGRKVAIALEEMGLAYEVHPVDIESGGQNSLEFRKVSPNERIPAIYDREEDLALMESGAILIYLAEKTGAFLPRDWRGRIRVIEWVMWQMGGFGPMLGQAHHFLKYHPTVSAYASKRYGDEAQRLYGVLDARLEGREFVAGDYSIADMAIWPWASRFAWQGIDLAKFPNVRRWYLALVDRPAVQRGFVVPHSVGPIPRPVAP
jgi:GSH-dependent disulfide-bond oxidoreductase